VERPNLPLQQTGRALRLSRFVGFAARPAAERRRSAKATLGAVMTFSPDYATARKKFRGAAERLNWALHAYPIGTAGPQGEDLTIDVAISLPTQTDCVLVLSSGLHGAEGLLGSAIQLAFLGRWQKQFGLPAGVRCVLLHGLNPHGFAWSRRFDADNIDPNRNFLLEGEEYSGSSAEYELFNRLLNPERPPSQWDLFYLRALWAVARHGQPKLKQALATGQYDFPKGLFFGGKGPSQTKMIIQQNLKWWIGKARTVAHLDFHTGLGAWGTCKLLLDYRPAATQEERLARWFGAGAYEVNDPEKVAFQPRGSFGQWCVAQRCAPVYVFAFAEFGTYGNISVIAGLRAENQAHHWGLPGAPSTARAKARLRELFCLASGTWRSRVLAKGIDLVDRAFGGLLEEDGHPVNS
jgi:hypothetical protein